MIDLIQAPRRNRGVCLYRKEITVRKTEYSMALQTGPNERIRTEKGQKARYHNHTGGKTYGKLILELCI